MRIRIPLITFAVCVLFGSLALVTLACSSAAPTATPVPTTQPAPAATATSVPAPAATATPRPTATSPVTSTQPQRGGVIRAALTAEFDNLDPAYMSLRGMRPVAWAMYNNMLKLQPDGTVKPELARSWEVSPDGKTVTFKLQPNVTFHDGTPLDAAAVKANYDRYLDPKVSSIRKGELSPPLLSVDVVDSLTVKFNQASPFNPLLMALAQQAGHIASPTAVQKANSYSDRVGKFGSNPVGSGPFKFVEWMPGDHVTLARNTNYWEPGLPYVDTIIFPMVADPSVQFAMLRTGDLEVMENLDASSVAIANRNPEVKVPILKGSRTRFAWYRLNVAPWTNKALREAFAYATNRKVLSDVLYSGMATPAYDDISPVYGTFYDPNFKAYDFDLVKAKAKLIEAGYPNGFTYTQPCASSTFEIQWCETLQSMYKDAGINAQLLLWNAASYFADFVSKKHDGPVWSGLSSKVAPYQLFSRYIYSTAAANAGYSRFYSNPEVDKLIDQAATVFDIAQEKVIWRKAAELAANDQGTTYHVHEPLFWGIRANIQNFEIVPDTQLRVRDVWIKK